MNTVKPISTVVSSLVFFILASTASFANEISKVDKAVKIVKELCLSGDQYDLSVDAKGKITLLKLKPGAAGSIHVTARKSPGATAISNNKLRVEANRDIINCIQPHIKKILNETFNKNTTDVSTKINHIASPSLLIEIIKYQQLVNVRESWGTEKNENFSDKDFENLVKNGKIIEITEELRNNGDYKLTINAIKKMKTKDRLDLFKQGAGTYKRTWREIGKIHPAGQTEAGQKAEKMIAKAIVALTIKLIDQPENVSKSGIRK